MASHVTAELAAQVNPDLKKRISSIRPNDPTNCNYYMVVANLEAKTRQYHSEQDATYTALVVPPQQGCNFSQPATLNFKLNNDEITKIPLTEGTVVFFSGFFLTHRQERPEHCSGPMINLGAYGNKRSYENAPNTILRNLEANIENHINRRERRKRKRKAREHITTEREEKESQVP